MNNCCELSPVDAETCLNSVVFANGGSSFERYILPDSFSATRTFCDALISEWDLLISDHDFRFSCTLSLREANSNCGFEYSIFEKWLTAIVGRSAEVGFSSWCIAGERLEVLREVRAFLFLLISFQWRGWAAISNITAIYIGDGYIEISAVRIESLNELKLVCAEYGLVVM